MCIFSENTEWNLESLAKTASYIYCFWQKRRVKLWAFGSIQSIQRRSRVMNFRQICGVKWSVFPKSAELNCAFFAKIQYSRKSIYVRNSKFNLHFFNSGPRISVVKWCKKCKKRTIKSRACVPLRNISHQEPACEIGIAQSHIRCALKSAY
jgi:hypothetical protein